MGLPTGTVTMLFSDMEGSTRLLGRLGAGYGDLLSSQRRLLRRAFGAHGGTEMGTEGDSFFVVFASAFDAVSACAASAHGGQVVMQATASWSRASWELSGSGQGAHAVDLSVADLGWHRLKDIAGAEHLYQLLIPGMPGTFRRSRAWASGAACPLRRRRSSRAGRNSSMWRVCCPSGRRPAGHCHRARRSREDPPGPRR